MDHKTLLSNKTDKASNKLQKNQEILDNKDIAQEANRPIKCHRPKKQDYRVQK